MTEATGNRYLELDALRGFAVMGILAMNIVAFAMPLSAYTNPIAYGSSSGADYAAWAFNFVFIDSKMRGLFSLLFGASTLLVIERASQDGGTGAGTHYARMFWLFLFGCVHFYLIWFGDILVLYAACGCVLYLLRNFSVKALWRWAIGFFVVQFLYVGLFALTMLAMVHGDAPVPADMAEIIAEIARSTGPDAATTAKELALYRGDYADIVAHRSGEMAAVPFAQIFQFGLETLGLMCTGMALYKSGAFTGGWDSARTRRWALTCGLLAIAPLALIGAANFAAGFEPIFAFASSFALSMPFDVLMTIAYACALVLLIQRLRQTMFIQRVAAAGRAAFSNYLGTSLLMTSLFYGYGLGLFGHVDRAALYLFVIGAWAIMLLWSKPWLIRFRYGPMEWLWRSLARLQLQPMRIAR